MEKPRALVSLGPMLEQTYVLVKNRFLTGIDEYVLRLATIGSVSTEEMMNAADVAAITLRKMQLLHMVVVSGVATTSDIVIGLCAEIVRALAQLGRSLSVAEDETRRAITECLRAVQGCAVAVGTMIRPGTIAELD